MRLFRFFIALCIFGITSLPAVAQTANESFKIVKLQSLNKATARTGTFEVEVGKTVKLGPLYIRPQTCQKPPETERTDALTFLQIWETPEDEEAKWIFSGWMFASSPGLSSMDHPVYDIWVVDCSQTEQMQAPEATDEQMKPQEADEEDIAEEDQPVVKLDGSNGDSDFSDYNAEDQPVVRIE
jgi:hypothetical protein